LAGRLFWSERALRDGATHAVARCAGDLTALDPVATGVVQRARDRHIRFVDLTPSQQRIAIARLDAAVSLCKAQPAL